MCNNRAARLYSSVLTKYSHMSIIGKMGKPECPLVLSQLCALLATVVAALISLAFAIAITQFLRFKISLHMASSAGAVTVCVLLFGPWLLLLTPLIPLIGWARWKVGAHTVLQACAGTILAILSTLIIFWLAAIL
jgi:hypothetical protein